MTELKKLHVLGACSRLIFSLHFFTPYFALQLWCENSQTDNTFENKTCTSSLGNPQSLLEAVHSVANIVVDLETVEQNLWLLKAVESLAMVFHCKEV